MKFDIENLPGLFDRLKGIEEQVITRKEDYEQEDNQCPIVLSSSFVNLHYPLDKAILKHRINSLGNYDGSFIITSGVLELFDGLSSDLEKIFDGDSKFKFVQTRGDVIGYLVRAEDKLSFPICAVNEVYPEGNKPIVGRMVSIGDYGAEFLRLPKDVKDFSEYISLLEKVASAVVNCTLKKRGEHSIHLTEFDRLILPINCF